MAQMKKMTLAEIKDKAPVTVGHNRTISVWKGVFCCFLHGHEIAQFGFDPNDDKVVKVTLDHHGYMTTTTRNAMKDFMKYFGVDGSVSFAKGKFAVRYRGVDTRYHDLEDCPSVTTITAMVNR